jgi:transposase
LGATTSGSVRFDPKGWGGVRWRKTAHDAWFEARRRRIVEAVRGGASQRATARAFGVGLGTVQRWLERSAGLRLDRVEWADRSARPKRTTRSEAGLEDLVLQLRAELRETSVLGEYGAAAIRAALLDRRDLAWPAPSVRTIGRILKRHGALDRRRRRAPAPPPGWYLPDVREWQAELDSFDTIEGLRLRAGQDITVLTGISLHGGLAAAWPEPSITVARTCAALVEHWSEVGLPGYAQFDNDGRFAGSASRRDAIGPVIRACLAVGVTPVFAPPRESGFQAAIESFNGRWQAKLWARSNDGTLDELQRRSSTYIAATRRRNAARIDVAPPRPPCPSIDEIDLDAPPSGRLIFLRRTSDQGNATILGWPFPVDRHWLRRLVRAEIDLDLGRLRFFALRRREPAVQPLLREAAYHPPRRWSG